jgi:hypothetical protein
VIALSSVTGNAMPYPFWRLRCLIASVVCTAHAFILAASTDVLKVQALCRGRPGGVGIPAAYLNSTQARAEAVAVLRELCKQTPSIKLL